MSFSSLITSSTYNKCSFLTTVLLGELGDIAQFFHVLDGINASFEVCTEERRQGFGLGVSVFLG